MDSGHSLADSLAILLTPAPRINDAEIDAADQDSAKLAERRRKRTDDDGNDIKDEEDGDESKGQSDLRRKAAPLLGDVDARYAGKTVSRKDVGEEEDDEVDDEEADDDDEADEEDLEMSVEEVDRDDDDDGEEKDSEDEMDPEFKKILMGSGGDEGEEMEEDDDGEDDEDGEEIEEEVKEERGEEESKSIKKSKSSEESQLRLFEKKLRQRHEKQEKENRMRKDMLKKAEAEKQKGIAVKRQLKHFDAFLEIRIRMQKMLEMANKMPQTASLTGDGRGDDIEGEFWNDFVSQMTSNGEVAQLEKCQKAMQNLSESVLKLQTTFLSGVEETRGAVKATKATEDVDQILEKRHDGVKKFRDSTLTMWQEKTAMTTAKSFHAFDTPILEQISLILADRQRLVNRTRTNRQSLVVLGKRKIVEEEKSDDEELQDGESMGKRKKDRLQESQLDDQIFDDSDFYQHLLRELIERKSSQITDSQALGKQMVQLHKLRIKNKRKVDTRASKGRKVRYDTHQKLIGFCASVTTPSSMPDSARDELFKSLFGQRWTRKEEEEKKEEKTVIGEMVENGAPQEE